MKEGHKYGLRAITKAHWDMLDEMACAETEMHRPNQGAPNYEPREPTARPSPHAQAQAQTQTQTTPSTPYPFDCLIFVRNVHPGTNKTTLELLCAQAFQDQGGDAQGHKSAHTTADVDYIDFSKGMVYRGSLAWRVGSSALVGSGRSPGGVAGVLVGRS